MERCSATLRHAHGISRCLLTAGHDGKHSGDCNSCDDLVVLSWTEHDEEWPI